ncbi:unnamed protein product [Phytomonas sp. EM1]|nr:unnamed protein product [Phytomonas sp. EM1]|eukprot:CCW63751.1 unnamed protein product [Phytomonas sp. isolate EM1]
MNESDSSVPSPVDATKLSESNGENASRYQAYSEPFGDIGFKIRLSSPNMQVELLTLGASINSVKILNPTVPSDSRNSWYETCLGFNDPQECAEPGAPIGSTHGRFAGRIANGQFVLDGKTHKLITNCGSHTLHGGPNGFNTLQWKYLITEGEDEIGVSFYLTSPHFDQGFPGELFVSATYAIMKHTTHPTLKYTLQANLSEKTPVDATVVNLTNHTYWNLNGVPRAERPEEVVPLPRPIFNHSLSIKGKYFAEVDKDLIPNGSMVPLEGTPHDYTLLHSIKEGMESLKGKSDPWGYDDPVALDVWDSTLREAAVLFSPLTQLQMRVSTTNPVLILYTANWLPDKASGKWKDRFRRHSGICLECQYFPNSPNVQSFPSTTLKKGEKYSETTVHEFQFMGSRRGSGEYLKLF